MYEIKKQVRIRKRIIRPEFRVGLAINKSNEGKITIEGILSSDIEDVDTLATSQKVETVNAAYRGNEFQEAIDTLLPDDDTVVWTNPQKTFLILLAQLLEAKL